MNCLSRILPMLALFLAAASSYVVSGQTPPTPEKQFAAPVAWTEYQIPEQKLSIAFPKLPIVRGDSDLCSQMEGGLYYAYARGVVYEFAWHAKSGQSVPSWCSTKLKFSRAAFSKRIEDLKARDATYKEADGTVAGSSARVLRSTGDGSVLTTRWLVWLNDRWLEFGITRRKETIVDEGQFLNALKLSSSSGVDVGPGSVSTLGDADVDQEKAVEGKPREGLVIVTKPRPAYTDEARRGSVQGTVILRVFFLRNGGVGTVVPVKELPFGLTEEAIKAARKVSFLPQTDGGISINVVKQIEYTFSLY